MKSFENVIITKVDKREQIVNLAKEHHIEDVNILINDVTYITLSHDLALQEIEKIKFAIKSYALLFKSTISYLSLSFSNCVTFHALPKVHKSEIAIRPVVSNICFLQFTQIPRYYISSFTFCKYTYR